VNDEPSSELQPAAAAPRWQPLGTIDRRVLGALAEKAKTTPDGYPMSLNSVCTACNQKSNRDPVMQLEPDDVQESLQRLRQLGAVGMIEGYGRVTKYRHYLYEWLGVEKVELSVMTELLLRGAQTEGELRGRVSRMDPVADLPALRALLASLTAKGLVIPLGPEGRGHMVAHALFTPREMEHLQAQHSRGRAASFAHHEESAPAAAPAPAHAVAGAGAAAAPPGLAAAVDSLRRELDDLRAQFAELQGEVQELKRMKEQG
jgi:uncharacterized protein YceH (UPF0502 family)